MHYRLHFVCAIYHVDMLPKHRGYLGLCGKFAAARHVSLLVRLPVRPIRRSDPVLQIHRLRCDHNVRPKSGSQFRRQQAEQSHAAASHCAAPHLPERSARQALVATCLISTGRPLYVKLELRAITKNDRTRDSPVIMSSAIPSEKYSCSRSPLILVNASTAIDGLLGVRHRLSLAARRRF